MNRALRPFGILLLAAVAGLGGCRNAVNPEEFCASGAEVCWSTATAVYLQINDAPYENGLLPEATHGYRIPTRVGAAYTLSVRQLTGGLRFHVSPGTEVDPGVNTIATRRYPGNFSFTAAATVYSVVIADQGGPTGSDYAVRVYSYDEPSAPLPETRRLEINAAPVAVSLLRNELMRFDFSVERRRDYEVRIDTLSGRVTAYRSVIASVDSEVHEQAISGRGDGLAFRAEHDGRMYLAVIDADSPTGSDFEIQVRRR